VTLTEIGRLRGLAYISTATVTFTVGQIDTLAKLAEASNADRELTGVLVYRDRQFLQYLEGPGDALEDLYQRLLADDRHEIQGRLDIAVPNRRFTDWGMRLLDPAWMPTVSGFDALHDLLRLQGHSNDAYASVAAGEILDELAVATR